MFIRLGSSHMTSSIRPVFLKKRKKGMNVNLRSPKVKKPKINETNLLLFVCLGSSSLALSVRPVFLKRKKEGNVNLSFPKVKTENNETNLLLFVRLGSGSMALSVHPVS